MKLAATVAASLIGISVLAQDREHYELKTYALPSAKLEALDAFLSKSFIPAAKKAGAGPVGVFREAETNGVATVHVLTVLRSAAQAEKIAAKLPDGISDSVETSLFVAIESLPKIAATDATKPRLLNLRIYESPTPEAHAKKVNMFNIGELAIFQRVGLTPVMFGSALSGPRMPNLTYLLVFPDDDARKAAWKKFGPDPEWQKLKAMPGYSDKEIIRKITNKLATPAPYSEI